MLDLWHQKNTNYPGHICWVNINKVKFTSKFKTRDKKIYPQRKIIIDQNASGHEIMIGWMKCCHLFTHGENENVK